MLQKGSEISLHFSEWNSADFISRIKKYLIVFLNLIRNFLLLNVWIFKWNTKCILQLVISKKIFYEFFWVQKHPKNVCPKLFLTIVLTSFKLDGKFVSKVLLSNQCCIVWRWSKVVALPKKSFSQTKRKSQMKMKGGWSSVS
jgi:hypothetical protein